MIRPWASREWLNGTGLPVVTSNAKIFVAAISAGSPVAVPGGRALLNSPVTKAVLPTTTVLQTTPLSCQVGSASAVTVAGSPASGAASAAGVAVPASAAVATRMPASAPLMRATSLEEVLRMAHPEFVRSGCSGGF